MKTPSPFIVRSRRLGDSVARYVPAYDGRVLLNGELDPLVEAAENVHRMIAIGTNIGNAVFWAELYETLTLDSILLSENKQLAHQQVPSLRAVHSYLDRIFDSYEVLDECFSAIMAYLALLGLRDHSRIKHMEQSLRLCENPAILDSYCRVKRLISKLPYMHVLTGLFMDATRIALDDVRTWITCDKRFELFLTMAEQGIKKGIPISVLRSYWLECGKKAGYDIAPGLAPQDMPTSLPTGLEIRSFLPEEVCRRLADLYASILRTRREDNELWARQWRQRLAQQRDSMYDGLEYPHTTAVSSRKEQSDTFKQSSVIVVPKGSKWLCLFRRQGDEQSSIAWARHTYLTILRNAFLENQQECPCSIILDGSYDAEHYACFPADDRRCIYHKLKLILS